MNDSVWLSVRLDHWPSSTLAGLKLRHTRSKEERDRRRHSGLGMLTPDRIQAFHTPTHHHAASLQNRDSHDSQADQGPLSDPAWLKESEFVGGVDGGEAEGG